MVPLLALRATARRFGITTALSTIALWAAGDMTLAELISSLPLALGGLGLAALGAKVDNAKTTKPARAR
ncbi:MAG: hypothetical protein ACR2J1_04020 [Methyloceanibacter sp.]|uniref:hypothetical protein n=1 Tax=Methyloceanibacter sp. TaxID=1965321 RepID=UPI003D9BF098